MNYYTSSTGMQVITNSKFL